MIAEDIRTLAIVDWLENDLLMTILGLEPASSDASFRRYFRAKTPTGQFIIMDAPPDKENTEPFIRIAALLSKTGLHVPTIFQINSHDGFLLLEDFGSASYLDRLNTHTANGLYQNAFDSLITLQSDHSLQNSGLPSYNEQLLKRELGIFEEWFLGHFLDKTLSHDISDSLYNILITSALEQPLTCVHRDFHSRNLMVLENNSPGILDFQDAVIGPITYDLVSLLRDCYIAWPEQQVTLWLTEYFQRLIEFGLINCQITQFKRWFDLMGIQRHLKAIGIFSRLHLRDGKSDYLKDIPRTLNYVRVQTALYPELDGFKQFFEEQILPNYGLTV